LRSHDYCSHGAFSAICFVHTQIILRSYSDFVKNFSGTIKIFLKKNQSRKIAICRPKKRRKNEQLQSWLYRSGLSPILM